MTKRQLKTALKLMREAQNHIQPDAAWVVRTRHELLKTIRHDAIRFVRPTVIERLKTFILAFVPRRTVDWVRGPVMAALSVVGMVLGGSLASVSAAEQSVPGDVLYPVKLAAEQARIMMQKEEPAKLMLKTEFVGRRAEEMKRIAHAPDVSKRTERIKEAADIMKKDLDAVKTQLHTVATASPAAKVVEVAKEIDKTSGEVAQAVKEMRDLVPPEAKAQVVEAQVAAVTTSVKAVQVLIEKHDDPSGQLIVSTEDIKRSVVQKVQGLQDGITDATKKVNEIQLQGVASTSIAAVIAPRFATTTAGALVPEELKISMDQLQAAQSSLEATKKLLEEEKLQEVKEKLNEAVKAVGVAEKSVATALAEQQMPSAVAQSAMVTPAAASSTPPVVTSTSTSPAVSVTSSVVTVTPPTSTTPTSTTERK